MLADPAAVHEAALRALGARGLVRPSKTTLQVVLGPIADQVAGEIREATAAERGRLPPPATLSAAAGAPSVDQDAWLAALGGRANIVAGGVCSTRLFLMLVDPHAIDDARLRVLGALALARPSPVSLHVVIGLQADAVYRALRLEPAAPP